MGRVKEGENKAKLESLERTCRLYERHKSGGILHEIKDMKMVQKVYMMF